MFLWWGKVHCSHKVEADKQRTEQTDEDRSRRRHGGDSCTLHCEDVTQLSTSDSASNVHWGPEWVLRSASRFTWGLFLFVSWLMASPHTNGGLIGRVLTGTKRPFLTKHSVRIKTNVAQVEQNQRKKSFDMYKQHSAREVKGGDVYNHCCH